MDITFGQICDRGLNPKRPVNQDRFLIDPVRRVFAVFDGVGGQRAGEIASQTAADTVQEALALDGSAASAGSRLGSGTGPTSDGTVQKIRDAVQFANRDIYELAAADPAYETMATTVAMVQIDGDSATVAHVGDSRVYRLDRGQLHRETIDHTDFDDQVRAGLVKPDPEAANDSHIINRALGAGPEVDVEIKTIRFSAAARFLVCTDGIYRMVSDGEIRAILGKFDDPQLAAEELKRLAHERGADDNLTAVVIHTGSRKDTGTDLAEESLSGRHGGSRRREPGGKARVGAQAPQSTRETIGGTAGQRDRINVALGLGTRPKSYSETGQLRAVTPGNEKRPALWILFLAGLVLLTGGFYLGLRVAEWRNARSGDGHSLATDQTPAQVIESARRELERGEYQEAESALRKVLDQDPVNVSANYWLGRAEMAEGNLQESVKHFDVALNLDPGFLDTYLQAAGAYEAMGDKTKASEMLARYLEARRKTAQGPKPAATR